MADDATDRALGIGCLILLFPIAVLIVMAIIGGLIVLFA